jgi:uncharacterized protein YcfJ
MKKLILIPLLLVSSVAFAAVNVEMEVVDVREIYTQRTVSVPVEVDQEYCYSENQYRRNSRGMLEKITTGGFGSTGGLLGTAAGVAIVDELGGNDVTKIIGGLLGNKIGNDISDRRRNKRDGTRCEIRTITKYERRYEDHLDHYLITVEMDNQGYSKQFKVKRNFAPAVGDTLRVQISVW